MFSFGYFVDDASAYVYWAPDSTIEALYMIDALQLALFLPPGLKPLRDMVNRMFRDIAQLKKETEMLLAEAQALETWIDNASSGTVDMNVEDKVGRLETLNTEERDRAMKEEAVVNKSMLEMEAITLLDKESERRRGDDTKQ
ncbi:hypothetical protein AXG93_2622s1030 [Marchantia polymorpha subsp. ruderalis]|uniref:Uncharacterized protein n=1 Tax=Marchantia polymorpha subsp. ruderalis TaxID=1480154 RepID=A0A176VVZ1_MARPO|nr:hypothetical protein AXG93_2622s1030 [Marchantia polymorpha subsp. ruderalis]